MVSKKDLIKALHFELLSNATHIEFAQFTLAAIDEFAMDNSHFARFVVMLKDAVEKEHGAFLWSQQKFMTKQLKECDKKRVLSRRMLREIVKAYTLSDDEVQNNAARKVLLAINQFGGVRIQYQSVEQRSGMFGELIDELDTKLSEEVRVLGVTELVERMKKDNNRFLKLYSERNQALAEHGVGLMAELQKETNRCLRIFFNTVNNAAEIGDYAQLKSFIDYMNVEIVRLRALLKQRATVSKNKKVEEAEETGI